MKPAVPHCSVHIGLHFSGDLLQNYVYFGHHTEPIIYIYDKGSLQQISTYRLRDSGGITDMEMFAPGVQPYHASKQLLLCSYNMLLNTCYLLTYILT